LALLAWRGLGLSRFTTRPLLIEEGPLPLDAIDVNDADVVDLRLVPGIGESLARRIIQYREQHGPFRSLDELRKVSGVGPATLERVRKYLRITSYKQEPMPPPRVVRGARPEPPADQDPPEGKDSAKGKKKPVPAQMININRATADQLKTLPGIGPALSARIIEARRQQPFRSVDELRRVKGIGVKTLARLRPYITVSDAGE
jgi:competence protein ComEA